MRLKKARLKLLEEKIDAILVSQPENRRYLSGFTGSAGCLIISADRAMLATDSRYYEQVRQEAPEFELVKVSDRLSETLKELLADNGLRRLGFESQHLTVDQLHTLRQAAEGVEWVPLKGTVEGMRAIKEEGEVAALRSSAALTDAAFAHLLRIIQPGMTEREAAWEIEAFMRTHGASKAAFDLIVAAGPNGALPHARPTAQAIQSGSPIVVDVGCVLDGYCSDMTRTICLGRPSPKYLEVWGIVRQAQQAAEDIIHAGLRGEEVYALAHGVIQEAGYGEFFSHGLGHGVGLAVHEAPRASRLSEDTLEAGMSLTIEPGIYLPGEFGVRLEDLVIVGQDRVEVLTCTPKEPVVV